MVLVLLRQQFSNRNKKLIKIKTRKENKFLEEEKKKARFTGKLFRLIEPVYIFLINCGSLSSLSTMFIEIVVCENSFGVP